MKTFDDAFAYVVGEEGKLSTDRTDPGNWTKGSVGCGLFVGTKYGISAAAYPLLDIRNLTLADARAVAKRDYWDKLAGDVLPYGTALCLFDFGYNSGISMSVRTAQRALGLPEDGVQGPKTHAALLNTPPAEFAREFTFARISAYRKMAGFEHNGNGWLARARRTQGMATA